MPGKTGVSDLFILRFMPWQERRRELPETAMPPVFGKESFVQPFSNSCGIIKEILVTSQITPPVGKLRRFTEWENCDKRYFFLLPFLWL